MQSLAEAERPGHVADRLRAEEVGHSPKRHEVDALHKRGEEICAAGHPGDANNLLCDFHCV